MDRSFVLDFVRVTEAAALASAKWIGCGDEKAADGAAVVAMRKAFNSIPFSGRVVIGEGERDKAPMLYIGEKVGKGTGPQLDLALDPLEGTTLCAQGREHALSVLAIAESGKFLHAPDTYMKKIAVGPSAKGTIDLSLSSSENLKRIAAAKHCKIKDLSVMILDRPRHADLIHEVRKSGARVIFITDGDVAAAIATCKPHTGVDVLMGIGGAPEGVIAAAALRCMGGDFQGQLQFSDEEEKSRAREMGISDLSQIYRIDDLAAGHVLFCATGVTQSPLLQGVHFYKDCQSIHQQKAKTHSIVMRSETGTQRFIEAEHCLERKPLL